MPKKRPEGYVPRPPGRPAKYPWNDWFDGKVHFIQPRMDFDGDIESMRQQVYTRARKDDIVVEVRRYGSGLKVRAILEKARTGTTQKYDWDTLLDGQTHTLLAGRDFRAAPDSFRQYARRQARDRGLRVETRLVGQTLTLRATGHPEPPASPADLSDLPLDIDF